MAIVYSVVNNVITITGYSLAVPCNFTDLYNADKAGSLSLHARTGIVGTDGAGVAVDRAERPADNIVLGGASNDLYITIANWNGTTATIRITGTDRDGAAQTEDIVVNANGAFYTTKWFKTITHTQVTVFTATSFDYDLTQGQWGVVSRQCVNQFCFNCKVIIGNGSTATWFADTKKIIIFPSGSVANGLNNFTIKANAHFRLGTLHNDANKETSDGCALYDFNAVSYVFFIIADAAVGVCELYQCSFVGNGGRKLIYLVPGCTTNSSKLYNTTLGNLFELSPLTASCYNVLISDTEYGIARANGTLDLIVIKKISVYAFYTHLIGEYSTTIKNMIVRNVHKLFRIFPNTSLNQYLINVDADAWNFEWSLPTTVIIYRQYEFDLKVIDKNNTAISVATVKIWDKDSNLVVDTTTNASGIIATQTITRGYYNQANGSTLQDVSPHTIEIKKSGYQTYKKKFTLDKKTDWTIALQKVLDNNFSKRVRINNY